MTRPLALACLALVGCASEKSAPQPKLQATYSVDLSIAVHDKAAELQRLLEVMLAEQQLAASVVVSSSTLTITPTDAAARSAIEKLVKEDYVDTMEPRPCDASAAPHTFCIEINASFAQAIEQAALSQTVATVRARLEAMKIVKPNVVERGRQIVVELPKTEDNGKALRSLIARAGKLEMKVVDDGSAFMQQLYAHVEATRDASVTANTDRWQADDGAHLDFYLMAHDTEVIVTENEAKRLGCVPRGPVEGGVPCHLSGHVVLESYLATLAATDPSFRVPLDSAIGFERMLQDPTARDTRPAWRTYYLERMPRLTSAAIADAQASADPVDGRPLVQLELTPRGAQTFGELTGVIAGRKLAILIDGRVQSAPVVLEAIHGGRVQITMGGGDRKAVEAERDELVKVLKTGALPAPLVEVSLIELP